MNILLASVSYTSPHTFHRKFLGLAYLHAHALADEGLRKRVHVLHEYYDMEINDSRTLAARMLDASPDLVAFGCYVWNMPLILEVARILKERDPALTIVLGGPQVEFDHLGILKHHPEVDFIAVGEGEDTFRELLHALIDGGRPGEVPGIALRGGEGPVLRYRRAPADDLDRFESPFLSGVLGLDELTGGAQFQTTRGCPYRCAYCAWGRLRPYAEFSMDRVEAEIRYFQAHGARGLFCVDSTFNLNNERAIRILDTMVDCSLEAALRVETHPELLNESFVTALSRTRMTILGLGIQTTNPDAMKNINRTWDPGKIEAVLDRLALDENCFPAFEIIMGLPGDRLETFKDTLTWAYRKKPACVYAFVLQVLPNSPLAREKERFEIREAGPESGHLIRSNRTFLEDQILVGTAMRNWNRILQQAFYRLIEACGAPAGDLIEQWTRFALRAGLQDRMADFQMHRCDPGLLERLADAYQGFCRELLAGAGLDDVSLHQREFLRYYFSRRRATHEIASFFDTVDIHGITLDPRFNLILNQEDPGWSPPSEQGFEETFAFDMKRLWTTARMEDLNALPVESRTYRFQTDAMGRAVAVEA